MSRDELERCATFLRQGLDLPRETQKRLVAHALGDAVAPHLPGCAFHRGEGCTCRDAEAPLDLGVKEALAHPLLFGWTCPECSAQGFRLSAADCDFDANQHAETHKR